MREVVIPSTGQVVRQDSQAVDPATGQVMSARTTSHLTTNEVLAFEPKTPIEMEFLLDEMAATLDRAQVALGELYEARYTAETEYVKAHAKAQMNAPGTFAADKKAYADLASIDELEALNQAKANQHAAEALERAVRSKFFGYMNLNKSVTAAYQGSSFRR